MFSILYKLRDLLWVYPEKIMNVYVGFKPFSSILLFGLLMVYLFTLLSVPSLYGVRSQYSTGEKFSEGLVGEVLTYNPIFISGSDIDRTVYELVYSRLISIKNGEPVPSVAYDWELSEDGKSIRFLIRDDLYWHDGEKVTADDVVYTVALSQQMAQRGYDTFGNALTGVTAVADAENSVTFTFEEIIGGVYETLSFYVLPQHIMVDLQSNQMYDYGKFYVPIGSGPYKVLSIDDNELSLVAFDQYPEELPIDFLSLIFFDDVRSLEVAFRNNLIDGIGNVDRSNLDFIEEYKNFQTYSIDVPQRKKLMFMNLRSSKMKSDKLRQAVAHSINRDYIVNNYRNADIRTNTPIPSNSWAYADDIIYYEYDQKLAKQAMEDAGYKYDKKSETYLNQNGEQLKLTFVYLDSRSNEKIVGMIGDMLEESGIGLNQTPVSYDSLINEVLATRTFDLLLMEMEVTSDPDQYNIWHSTKVNYPDLNISGYEYDRMDILLEGARLEQDRKIRNEDYEQIQRYLALDVPVVTLFEPSYTYVVSDRYQNIELKEAEFPFERFWNISRWKIEE